MNTSNVLSWRFASDIMSRTKLAWNAGITFGGLRDVWGTLGYEPVLTYERYRKRYDRGEVAGRIIDTFPQYTWRGIGEVIETDDPKVETAFEKQWNLLSKRLNVWTVLCNADILAGIGRYAVVLIGAPGKMETPLPKRLKPDDIKYLRPYSEGDVSIDQYDEDTESERFGLPLTYKLSRSNGGTRRFSVDRTIHWSRIIHLCESLDDNVFGPPRLERVWNRLDDLEKVVGGGSEAFWLRAHQGFQFDIDKDIKFPQGPEGEKEKKKKEEEIQQFINGMQRAILTRGVTMNTTKADVAEFATCVSSIIGLISAGTSIPQRILLGSERGELASSQDKNEWTSRVQARRDKHAGPNVVNQLVNRLIEHEVLPTPKEYKTRWPEVFDVSKSEQIDNAKKYADVNRTNGDVVLTVDEIRDMALGLDPLDPEDVDDPNAENVDVEDPEQDPEEEDAVA